MRLFRYPLCAMALLPILSGCTNPIPDCNDSSVQEMVTDYLEDESVNQPLALTYGAVIAELTSVREVGFNKKTRVRDCIGVVNLTGQSSGQSVLDKPNEIQFQVAPTEDNLGYQVKLTPPP